MFSFIIIVPFSTQREIENKWHAQVKYRMDQFLCCEYKIVSALKYSGRTKASDEILFSFSHEDPATMARGYALWRSEKTVLG